MDGGGKIAKLLVYCFEDTTLLLFSAPYFSYQ